MRATFAASNLASGRIRHRDLVPQAFRFVDFLIAAGQRYWQILPLGPTGFGDSPYQCFSAFAGNNLIISPENLVEDGLITAEISTAIPNFPNTRSISEPFKIGKTIC